MTITAGWTTPIYRAQFAELPLIDQLLQMSQVVISQVPPTEDPYALPNYDQTDRLFSDLLAAQQPLVVQLHEIAQQHITQYLATAFQVEGTAPMRVNFRARMYKQGEMLAYHSHDSIFTGIVYLTPAAAGLRLHDPRTNAGRYFPVMLSKSFEDIVIMPELGEVVIFPSYVYHSTMINQSPLPRIVLPFDVYA